MITPAYPVPFIIERRTPGRTLVITNRSREQLSGLSFSILGAGLLRTTAPLLVAPGQQIRLLVRGDDLPRQGVVVVRWFRPDGAEYLWRISF
ncbi:hypothetical protein [Agreia sp. COWG]|uniref:hypothetical protein n=1 Tax=Agreia sp. COWG TaxID=2773266 RepID=UPI001925AA77|nr:hypothetical protein [Agreia sp. COWG]CAD6001689.1 conserved protein of unknown function [Agreia sp. COWG]